MHPSHSQYSAVRIPTTALALLLVALLTIGGFPSYRLLSLLLVAPLIIGGSPDYWWLS